MSYAKQKQSYKRGVEKYFYHMRELASLERAKTLSQNRTKIDNINRDIVNQRFELKKTAEENQDKEKKLAEFYINAYLHTHPQTVASEAKYFTEVFIAQNGKTEIG